MPVSHSKTLLQANGGNTALVEPSDWNSNHIVSLTTSEVIWASVNNTSISNGYLVFTNSNGLSFGLSTNAAGGTLTGAYSQNAMFSAGVSTIGNTSGTSGLFSNAVVLAGGNNVTLSQSTSTNGATITISAGAQSNQSLGLYASGNTINSSSTTVDARSFSFNASGAISVGFSGGSMVISETQSIQSYNILSASGNTSGTLTTYSTGAMVLAGGNNITLSQSSNTITVSGANQILSIYAVGNTTAQSSSSTISANAFSIDGAGAVSVGMSAGSLVLSATQSNQTMGIYLTGNIPGVNPVTSSTVAATALTLSGQGGAYVGLALGSIIIYDPILSDFEPWPNYSTTSQSLVNSSLYLAPMTIPDNLSFQMIQLGAQVPFNSTRIPNTSSNVSSVQNISVSANQSINAYLFTRLLGGSSTNLGVLVSTQMSLQTSIGWTQTLSSSSQTQSIAYSINFPTWASGTTTVAGGTTYTTWQTTTSQYTQSTSTTAANSTSLSTLFPSFTQWSNTTANYLMFIPFGTSLSAGEYWLGLQAESASAGSNIFRALTFSANTLASFGSPLGYIGQVSNSTLALYPGQGVFSATYATNSTYVNNAGQASGVIAFSQINSQASNIRRWVQFKNNVQ